MKNRIEYIKKNIKLVVGTLIVGLLLGALLFRSEGSHSSDTEGVHSHESDDPSTWTCSMHPQIKQDKPGDCPICGMDLIPLASMTAEGDDTNPNEIVMTESASKLAAIQTMVVSSGNPEKSIHLQGKIYEDERRIAELTARFGGRIEDLSVNFTGQNVKKGQKLATIYSPELVTAQRELLESIAFKEARPTLYTAARGKLKLWDLTDAQIQAIEEKGEPQLYFDVLAPISGTVAKRYVAIGDYVKSGDPLFKVVDLTKVWALFDAYENDLPWIKLKDEVEFTIQSLPGKTFTEKVSFIDPFIDAETRVAKVRVELKNHKLEIKPEMFLNGTVHSKVAASEAQILIPKSALLWTGKRAVVYVKVPNRTSPSFLYREIVLGPEAGNFYVVAEGLEAGEEVAVNGVFKIDAAAQLQGLPSMMNPDAKLIEFEQGEHTSFKVKGNCEMCKTRIETAALSISGVISANWEAATTELHLKYKEGVSLAEIHKAIAKVGHDTALEKAPDAVYNELPGCCLYERKPFSEPATNLEKAMVKVGGLCPMCKDRIEKTALAVAGVKVAEWDSESQMLHLNFDAEKTNSEKIQQAIADTGHDTEKFKADDSIYNKLPKCCQYRE